MLSKYKFFHHNSPLLSFPRPEKSTSSGGETNFSRAVKDSLFVTYRIFKYLAIATGAIIGLAFLTFRGGHFYIEHFHCATPATLSRKARDNLRIAYLREELYPDLNLAQAHLARAFHIAHHEQGLPLTNPATLDIMLRMANNSARLDNLYEARLEYQTVYQALIFEQGQEGDSMQSNERKENLRKAVDVSKKLANLSLRMGDNRMAEEYLVWAIGTLNSNELDNTNGSKSSDNKGDLSVIPLIPSTINENLVQCTLMLAGVYAKQKKFEKSLPLYLGTLKMIQEYTTDQKPSQVTTNWNCWEGITMCHLGEIFYAMGQPEKAHGWFQQGLLVASNDDTKDCEECCGVILNNLGLIYEQSERFKEATSFYERALEHAERANDVQGVEELTRNLKRMKREENVD